MKRRLLKKSYLIALMAVSTMAINAQNFTEITTSIEGMAVGSIGYSDVDNDGDIDLINSGVDTSGARTARLFLNDGSGTYSEVAGTPFTGVSEGEVAFSDVDGDGDEDVIITGLNDELDGDTRLYINDGTGIFTEDESVPFINVYGSGIDFSDIDFDGDEDVLITGYDETVDNLNAKLYSNNGNGVFSEVAGTPFNVAWDGVVKFVDTDNDGDEDVILTGRDNNTWLPKTALYTNENGIFSEVVGTPFKGAMFSSISAGDIDGDGDYDILISGQNSSFNPETSLYINDGGNFTEDLSNPFVDVDFCSNAFSDIENDGDMDVLIAGYSREGTTTVPVTKLYANDGNGVFIELTDETFVNVGLSAVAFFDADGDNVDDLLITGDLFDGNPPTANLYINNNDTATGPINDDCNDALAVTCGDIIIGSTSTATDSGGNPAPDVFYTFTGTGNEENVTISLCDGGTDYDSLLRLFTDCTLTNEIIENDDFCGVQSELSFLSDGTSTYFIMVEGFDTDNGNFSMEISCVIPTIENDDCEGAIAVSCGDTVVGDTSLGTDSGYHNSPDVFYSYTGSGDPEDVTLSLCDGGTDYDSFLRVFTDCSLDTQIVENDDFCGSQSELSFTSDGTSTYYIMVEGFDVASGNFSLAVSCESLGTEDVDLSGFNYYPNPTNETINFSALENIERVTIYNLLGQKVVDQSMDVAVGVLNVANLAKGTYIMKVIVGSKTGTFKVIKK